MTLCERCGLPSHPKNVVVQAVTVRQGGPHNKGSGVGGFKASGRGTLASIESRNAPG